ncbi:MAG: endosialidase [Lachnospiraceae bacterium]|nr:endosialidase [Lachnospiraceae bacterium]
MGTDRALLCAEENGTLSFGDHLLSEKKKLDGFEKDGNIYKVKTFSEITKLEKNGAFLYESVPGTSVSGFSESGDSVSFSVAGGSDCEITLGLSEGREYEITVRGSSIGKMKTGIGGKLSFSLELSDGDADVTVKAVS